MEYTRMKEWPNTSLTSDEIRKTYLSQRGTRLKMQVATFLLSYVFWICVHI